MGAGWCPPGMLGIGIGGTAEKAMLLAKEVADGADRHPGAACARAVQSRRGTAPRAVREGQRAGHRRAGPGRADHGAGRQDQGLPDPRRQPAGGADPQLRGHPPRALHPGRQRPGDAGAAVAGGLAEAHLRRPQNARRVDLDTITPEEVATWKPGEVLLLNGRMLTGRDAAHKRMVDMLNRGEELPVDLRGRFIYYVGPVDPVRDEVVGPAGPDHRHPHGQVHRAGARRRPACWA